MLKRRWPLVLIAPLLVLLFAASWYIDAVNRDHPAPWPMAGGGSGLRHFTPVLFPQAPQILWSLPIDGDQHSTPLIGADGTLYLATGTQVLAVGPDGKRRWLWRSPMRIQSMALSRHGTLYAMDAESMHALDEQGRLQWRRPLPGPAVSPLLVGQGGLLYYAGGDRLHALSDSGVHRWTREIGTVVAGPVESGGGLILVATPQQLVALRSNGQTAWSRTLGDAVPTRPLAAGLGYSYLRTRTGLLVLNEKGEIESEQQQVSPWPVNLAVGQGIVQEGLTRRGQMGRPLWTAAPGVGYRTLSTMLDGHGNALLMESQGLMRASGAERVSAMRYRLWDPEGRERWALDPIRPLTEPAVDAKGNLCFIGLIDANAALICVGDKPKATQ